MLNLHQPILHVRDVHILYMDSDLEDTWLAASRLRVNHAKVQPTYPDIAPKYQLEGFDVKPN